eukprot:m.224135 g.224135  ORF g.224135 m.224135 type:complete len:131 (+) comp34062_c0_seq1:207-599(+)
MSHNNATAGPASDAMQEESDKDTATATVTVDTVRCDVCGAHWNHGMWTEGCRACGGAALERPCYVCDGRCGATWQRDVRSTRVWGEAHWDGECRLPPDHQEALWHARMLQDVQPTDDDLVDAMDSMFSSS